MLFNNLPVGVFPFLDLFMVSLKSTPWAPASFFPFEVQILLAGYTGHILKIPRFW
jgi:hypothetical protein